MSSNIINEDLRNRKTEKALYAAIYSLLRKHNFKIITVKRVCEEALVSRATFYAHFIDKYDLLNHWMTEILMKNFNRKDAYEQMEEGVNHHINKNIPVLKHLIEDADEETLKILFDCILSTIYPSVEKSNMKKMCPENIVLSNFYAGGILTYLLWQIKNKFPPDIPLMNKHLYALLHALQDRQSEER